jgi:diacylglycerol kinase family enzyme
MSRRISAILALAALVGSLVLFAISSFHDFAHGLVALVLVAVSAVLGWRGLTSRGNARLGWWALATLFAIAALVVVLVDGIRLASLAGVALLVIAIVAAKLAYSVHVHLPLAIPPEHPVVVWNPKSGGGKALSNNLASEALKRGIRPIELGPDDDLVSLVQDAVASGADGLMAAGGDGTQALVAAIAAENDLPFACIPAGTRNHFALDLGVDRDDVVGALDAFVNGGEKRVDLGEVGGRVFVNNVSLGLYAVAVQSSGYRDAKIRTLLETAPAMLASGDAAESFALRWTGPDGEPQESAAMVLVSNNVYRLGRVLDPGTRPRMDAAELGVAVIGAATDGGTRRALEHWSTEEFVVEAESDIPIGVDGEAMTMPSPLTFRIRPGALRVRIAPQHPGASPSANEPTGIRDGFSKLLRIASGSPAQL